MLSGAENMDLTEAEKMELISKIADDPEARAIFAATLSIPVRQTVEAQSSVRQIFAIDRLPPGALASYPVDFGDVVAWVMPRVGAVPQNIVEGEDLLVPTFEIASSVEFKMAYARDGRYNISQRAAQKLANAFVATEEASGWATIRAAVRPDHTVTVSGNTTLSKTLINEMISMMQGQGYNADLLVCSTNRAADIREWDHTQLDDTTRREVFARGGMGSIWGVQIMPLRSLADNEVYLFDTSRFGVMPIRQDFTTYEDPTAIKRLRIGIIAFEEVGFAVIDDKAVVKGEIS